MQILERTAVYTALAGALRKVHLSDMTAVYAALAGVLRKVHLSDMTAVYEALAGALDHITTVYAALAGALGVPPVPFHSKCIVRVATGTHSSCVVVFSVPASRRMTQLVRGNFLYFST